MLVMAFLTITASAWAETSTTICVPEAASKPVLSTNTKGECPSKGTKPVKYKAVTVPDPALLSHMNYLEKGVDGKPTIQFSGVNVQVVNGEGKTASTNGAGNIVIGYDENGGSHAQTGSHDLILGEEQTFVDYGGLVAGSNNSILGPFDSVTGGRLNVAEGDEVSIGGGALNHAKGNESSVSGGRQNTADSLSSSVSGGYGNIASGPQSSVSGGTDNGATGPASSVSGGNENAASGSVVSIAGGSENSATGVGASVQGGFRNHAEGELSSIFGGDGLTATIEYEAIP